MPIFRNAAWAQRVRPKPGTIPNLTGMALRMQIRAVKGTVGSPLVELNLDNGGITMVDAPSAIFDLALSKSQSKLLPSGTLFFDIVDSNTDVRLFGGRVLVEDGVTDD